jgi:hypothetical protein
MHPNATMLQSEFVIAKPRSISSGSRVSTVDAPFGRYFSGAVKILFVGLALSCDLLSPSP